MAASVVRDRQIANRSRSGDLDLQRGSCGPVARGPVPRDRRGGARQAPVVRDRLIANGSRSGDLDLQNENPENPENLANPENPAFNLTKIKK